MKVSFNIDDAVRGLEHMRQTFPQAISRAVNRAADSGASAMTRAIAQDTGLKSKDVRQEIKVRRASAGGETAEISVTGRRLPLIAFGARGPEPSRGRGRGVSYRLGAGRARNENAFIATMPSTGHRGVFVRVSGASHRGPAPNRSQLPIRELFGPSLPHVFRKYLSVGKAKAQEALVKNLRSELRFAQSTR